MQVSTILLFVTCRTLVSQLSNKRLTADKQAFDKWQTEKKKGQLSQKVTTYALEYNIQTDNRPEAIRSFYTIGSYRFWIKKINIPDNSFSKIIFLQPYKCDYQQNTNNPE